MNIVSPVTSFALTSGPTAPEATSFEPVDTTDIVNLATGDLVYNIPLLEVPGPSGGYPLSLSYHAGIQPDEEASWVGLGWTLNPGAITRNVNGFADDHEDVSTSDRVYWEGGVSKSYSVGISVGLKGLASVNAGLAFSQDTYQGNSGLGVTIGGSVGLNKDIGLSGSIGISQNGEPIASVGLNTALFPNANNLTSLLSGGLSLSTNFRTATGNVGISALNIVGANISSGTSGTKFSANIGNGAGRVNNNKAGRITTSVEDGGGSFPIVPGISVSVAYQFVRYWMDETESVSTFGSLHSPTTAGTDYDLNAFDSYTLFDPQADFEATPDPNFTHGASFLNYDDYSVNSQGLSGSIRPYSFRNVISRQNRKKDDAYEIKQYPYDPGSYSTDRFEFRFVNDFSNRSINDGETWSTESGPLSVSFGTSVTGKNGNDGVYGNHLAGSKHIDWYSNSQIKAGISGFIETNSSGFIRDDALGLGPQIGAFRITNESGVTYHFSLPVYAYDEYQYSENITHEDGQTFNEFKKPERYAYTWFLTGVTGPDFVDRSIDGTPNGVFDEYDWGYWVEFQYGKWTENYAWRNPPAGFTPDLDNNFENYASGKKEIYYLDVIRTKSHTAIFVKDVRFDGKGSAYGYNLQKKSDLGFLPSDYNEIYTSKVYHPVEHCNGPNSYTIPRTYDETRETYTHTTYPTSQLRLSHIYLFENEDLEEKIISSNNLTTLAELKAQSNELDFDVPIHKVTETRVVSQPCETYNPSPNWDCECTRTIHYSNWQTTEEDFAVPLHLGDNLFDSQDIELLANFESSALRVISLTTDYELAPETQNSFDHAEMYDSSPLAFNPNLTGKLTLRTLSFKGKGGISLLPPTQFFYDHTNAIKGVGTITANEGSGYFRLNPENSVLTAGDLIVFNSNGKKCYAVILTDAGSDLQIKIIGNNTPIVEQISWSLTKNPPYRHDATDIWGLFKSDAVQTNGGLDKVTSSVSARSVDAWSLRAIKNGIGSRILIDYGADTYSKSVLQREHSLIIEDSQFIGVVPGPFHDKVKYRLTVKDEGHNLQELFYAGGTLSCAIIMRLYDLFSGTTNLPIETAIVSAVASNTIEVVFDYLSLSPGSDFILGGNIFFYAAANNWGGGIRVNQISIDEDVRGISLRTKYDYTNNGISSGVTSYEPHILDKIEMIISDTEAENKLRDMNRKRVAEILLNAREVPTPGVVYEYVTVRGEIYDGNAIVLNPTKTRYHFEVLRENMVGYIQSASSESSGTYDGISYTNLEKKEINLKDFTNWVGTIKSVQLLEQNDNKITESIYHYLNDNIQNIQNKTLSEVSADFEAECVNYSNQGVIQESLWDARFVKQDDESYKLYATISKRHVYPSIQIGRSDINYKTGIRSSSENLKFDFYTGGAVKVRTSDSYGNEFVTERIPAYHFYNEMGLALNGGKNMLVQEGATKVVKVSPGDPDNSLGVVLANAQTWSQLVPVILDGAITQQGIWRKRSSYSWVGNDIALVSNNGNLYPSTSYVEFNGWSNDAPSSTQWQKNGEITLYDPNSHALEAKDINGNFAATKMSSNYVQVFASAANASYNELAYSGAEDTADAQNGFYGGDVKKKDGVEVTRVDANDKVTTHTGKKALRLTSVGSRAFEYAFIGKANRTYRASVWTNHADGKIKYSVDGVVQTTGGNVYNGGAVLASKKAGAWHLVNLDIPLGTNASSLVIWCETSGAACNFDDFRLHPVDGPMTSYVYNEWGELSHMLDNNNLYTEYQYDEMGRLVRTFRETLHQNDFWGPNYGDAGIVKVSEIEYNYGKTNEYTFSVTSTWTGNTGSISPAGSVAVKQGEDRIFTLVNNCGASQFNGILMDKSQVHLSLGTTMLYDGTEVVYDGAVVVLRNIQSPHTVKADFSTGVATGNVTCHVTQTGCPTGNFNYTFINSCGTMTNGTAVSFGDVPSSLKHLIPTNCLENPPEGCSGGGQQQ